MKKIIVGATLLVAFSGTVQAQGVPSQEQIHKAYMDYATPGEVHKMLAKSDGMWTEEISMWMNPDGPPVKSKATITNKMILGGRYQHAKHEGMMESQPFEGYSIVAYDNAKKIYQSTWIDNMGTGIMYMEGTWDPATKTVHYRGKMVDPVSGTDIMCREEYTIIDENTHKMVMYTTMPGKPESKMMEIMMKRDMKSKAKK